jgi:hypothetical protein
MVRAELPLASLHDLNLELLRLPPPALLYICRCEVGYTRQRVRMVSTERLLVSLHYLYEELLRL